MCHGLGKLIQKVQFLIVEPQPLPTKFFFSPFVYLSRVTNQYHSWFTGCELVGKRHALIAVQLWLKFYTCAAVCHVPLQDELQRLYLSPAMQLSEDSLQPLLDEAADINSRLRTTG